jgi:predicted Fe-Mo cluster-binding NifX family protein
MKIAVTSTGNTLDSQTDPRFGRAEYFIIADPDTMEYEPLQNKQNMNLPQGAGIQAASAIVNKKVKALITGNCGPKAFMVLQQGGVQVLLGGKGSVSDAIVQYKNGELSPAQEANVEGHWV